MASSQIGVYSEYEYILLADLIVLLLAHIVLCSGQILNSHPSVT